MQNQTPNISPLADSQSPIAHGRDTNRLPWLDFASGIMILWMIVYHAISCAWGYEIRGLWGITDASLLPEGIHAFINSEGKLEVLNPCVVYPWLHFFMPWFFYKSGQFFKKSSVKELFKKDSKKLLKTFAIWSAIGYVFYLLLGLMSDSLTLRNTTYSIARRLFLWGQIPINGPLWFLLTLFGVCFIGNKILPEKEEKYMWLKIFLVVLVGYLASYLAYRFNHHLLPYWIANGVAGLSFFALGYAMRDLETKCWLIVPCAIVYVLGCVFGFPMVEMLSNNLLEGNYLLWIPVTFCCIFSFNSLCKYICKNVRLFFVEYIGQNAMLIYLSHALIYVTISKLCEINEVSASCNFLFVLIILGYTLFLPILLKAKNLLIKRCL